MNPTRFTATTSWSKCMASLPDNVRLEVYDALFSYVDTRQEPANISPEAMAAFAFIRADLDVEFAKRDEITGKRIAAANKRWSKTTETTDNNNNNNNKNSKKK